MSGPFGPRHRKVARALIAESNNRKARVRLDEPAFVSVIAHQHDGRPLNVLSAQSWVTVPPQALYTAREACGLKFGEKAIVNDGRWNDTVTR